MATRDRPIERANRASKLALDRIGVDLRAARVGAGLALVVAGRAAGISTSQLSRIERGLAARVSFVTLVRCAAVVGLDLPLKAYPGGDPLRDAGQSRLISTFGQYLHPALRWATEVPLPAAGDQRAWDGLVAGVGWRFGVEVETQPSDEQALLRRLALKERDGEVDGVILVVPDTRRVRHFLRAAGPQLATRFPVTGGQAIARLARGEHPGGSAVVVLRRSSLPPGGSIDRSAAR